MADDTTIKLETPDVIEIPGGDITIGHDPDGLPKTVPADADEITSRLAKQHERLQRERDALARERDEERERAAHALAFAEAAERERIAALNIADTRTDQALNAHYARIQGDHERIDGAIEAARAQAIAAQRELRAAREANDLNAEIAATERLAESKAAVAQLETGKIAVSGRLDEARSALQARAEEMRKPAPKPREAPPRPEPRQPTPDEWIDNTARSAVGDDGADWLRKNKQYVTDASLHRKFLAFAQYYAAKNGEQSLKDSEFTSALDSEFLGNADKDDASDNDAGAVKIERTEPKRAQPAPVKTPAAAPVSRNQNNFFSSRNMNASQVKAPPDIVAWCRATGLDPVKYTLEAVELIKQGKLDKAWLDPDYDRGLR